VAPWLNYKGVDLFRPAGSAYTYTTGRMEIDADGAPNAYHPHDTGLDALANAGYPHGGWKSVLVVDPANPSTPYIQLNGPTAGYFVSMTTLRDGVSADIVPQKYVDATRIPYIVFPSPFYQLNGTGVMGDFVMAKNLHDGTVSTAIVADVGPDDPLGEVSMALVTGLGGSPNPNPRTGQGKPHGPFRYVVFPRSRNTPSWPLTAAEIEQEAQGLLAAAGGWAAFDTLS
jgi:hypothetical protein